MTVFKPIPTKSWVARDCLTKKPVQLKLYQDAAKYRMLTVEVVDECYSSCSSVYIDGWYFKTYWPKAANGSDYIQRHPSDDLGNFYGEKTFGMPANWLRLSQIADRKKRQAMGTWVFKHFKRVKAKYC
jgi:hypothetical protein